MDYLAMLSQSFIKIWDVNQISSKIRQSKLLREHIYDEKNCPKFNIILRIFLHKHT